MEGVVVSRQILVGALAPTRRLVLETFAERLQSTSAAFHNQQARNGVRTNSVSTSLPGFKAFELFNLQLVQINGSSISQPASSQ
jgi:hypothetical protein